MLERLRSPSPNINLSKGLRSPSPNINLSKGLRSPLDNVIEVKITSKINLPKGLRSPWTVLRTVYTDYTNIKDASLWAESDYGSTQP